MKKHKGSLKPQSPKLKKEILRRFLGRPLTLETIRISRVFGRLDSLFSFLSRQEQHMSQTVPQKEKHTLQAKTSTMNTKILKTIITIISSQVIFR